MSDKKIVPFGKYKGQPVEVLAADRKYSEWLLAQEWFREKFMELFSAIATVHQPADTPEHNALQAKFLNPDFLLYLLSLWRPDLPSRLLKGAENFRASLIQKSKEKHRDKAIEDFKKSKLSEFSKNWKYPDPPWNDNMITDWPTYHEPTLMELNIPAESQLQPIKIKTSTTRFEDQGADVSFNSWAELEDYPSVEEWECTLWSQSFRIELKPTLGDEYPTVLRQVVASKCNLVVIQAFLVSNLPFLDVKRVFSSQHIDLILLPTNKPDGEV